MTDVIYHLLAGAFLSGLILMLKKPVRGERPDWLVFLAVLSSLLLGLAKEAADKFLGWGTPEVADITATFSGGILALGIIAFIDWIVYVKRQ